jgi:hypothetical protein
LTALGSSRHLSYSLNRVSSKIIASIPPRETLLVARLSLAISLDRIDFSVERVHRDTFIKIKEFSERLSYRTTRENRLRHLRNLLWTPILTKGR